MTRILLVILIIILAILNYRLWFAGDGLVNVFHFKKSISIQRAENDAIVRHNAAIASEIDSLKKGGIAIENRARSDLGMVKKGEVFYQVLK